MNKYTELSDFEINKKIFILDCKENGIQYKNIEQGKGRFSFFSRRLKAQIKYDNEEEWVETEWVDAFSNQMAMNLAEVNKIAMIPKDGIWHCGSGWNVAEDKKLTRAICLAYLLMKDAENEG
ncbi:hypothetical protein M2263_001871 [Providencia alcalifaciens]|nr:hypothetical protein [Providencia alcalifaciens]